MGGVGAQLPRYWYWSEHCYLRRKLKTEREHNHNSVLSFQENDNLHLKQKQQGSTFSLRSRRSVLSLVYGEQDVVLDETIHKAMFDQAANTENCLTLSQAESMSVFQITQNPQDIKDNTITRKPLTNKNQSENPEKSVKKCCSCCAGLSLKCEFWTPFRKRVKRVVESKVFEAGIITIILINTLFMSIQYHGMDEDLGLAIDIVNLVSYRPKPLINRFKLLSEDTLF